MEEKKEPKLVHRLIPCPQYDVSGMECWLSDMAKQGYFPSVVLQEGNKILYARFYTNGSDTMQYELEEWAGLLAECLVEE